MKTTVTVHHTEMVIPPRCRKPRPQEGTTELTVNIREVSAGHAPVAFIVSEYNQEPRMVRMINGKLYRQVQDRQSQFKETLECDETIPLWVNQKAGQVDWAWHLTLGCERNMPLEQHKQRIAERAANTIIVDGDAYERTGEPYYSVATFGLGNNHGGTGFFVGWADYRDRKKVWGMSAADGQAAIEHAVDVALNRGDTKSVEYIRNGGNGSIEVVMPSAIKRRYLLNQNP